MKQPVREYPGLHMCVPLPNKSVFEYTTSIELEKYHMKKWLLMAVIDCPRAVQVCVQKKLKEKQEFQTAVPSRALYCRLVSEFRFGAIKERSAPSRLLVLFLESIDNKI